MANKKKSTYIPHSRKKSSLEEQVFTGKIEVVKNGMGYVSVENLEKDIIVRQDQQLNALSGDTVTVKVTSANNNTKRTEGVVTAIVKRSQEEFVGSLKVSEKFAFFVSQKQNMNFDVFIPLKATKGAKDGEKVAVRIVDWGTKKKSPVGEVVEIFDNIRENEVAMKEIILDAGFSLRFPDEVIAEADAIPKELDNAEIKRRKDFRGVLTITIDPVDAKDFDDAISYRKLENGNHEIGVHIADVSHYVKPNTALDKEAFARATSVYLPDRVLPMLPENISNVLCSLRPNEQKFTFSSVFEMNDAGEVLSTWIGRTVIESDRRYAYEEAQEIIETGAGENAEVILLLNKIAATLRTKRFKDGAINFNSQEIRFQLDENGIPVGIMIKESKEANKLIEEFMLLANRSVAEFVGKVKINKEHLPFPYRVHDQPVQDKLENFAKFASRFGYKLLTTTPETIATSFNEMLAALEGKPEQNLLEQLGIRTMAKASYTADNIGHYGLGFKDYCHFTSPIRRYPDVMVHRIVQEIIDKAPVADKEMDAKCDHCSERERKAMEAERNANKYKQVEFMSKFIGDEFEALISGVSAMGFWAETVAQKCEGMISLTELLDYDNFEFSESDYALIGKTTGIKFSIGQLITIRVVNANLEKRQIDFDWVPTEGIKKRSGPRQQQVPNEKKSNVERKLEAIQKQLSTNFKKTPKVKDPKAIKENQDPKKEGKSAPTEGTKAKPFYQDIEKEKAAGPVKAKAKIVKNKVVDKQKKSKQPK